MALGAKSLGVVLKIYPLSSGRRDGGAVARALVCKLVNPGGLVSVEGECLHSLNHVQVTAPLEWGQGVNKGCQQLLG